MDDGDIANLELSQRPRGQLLHLLEGHLLVRFVIQIQSAAAAGVVANDAFEDGGGPVLRPLDALQNRSSLDRPADDGGVRAAF